MAGEQLLGSDRISIQILCLKRYSCSILDRRVKRYRLFDRDPVFEIASSSGLLPKLIRLIKLILRIIRITEFFKIFFIIEDYVINILRRLIILPALHG